MCKNSYLQEEKGNSRIIVRSSNSKVLFFICFREVGTFSWTCSRYARSHRWFPLARLFLTGYKRPDRSTASKIRVSFINSLYRWMETGDTPLYASFSRPEFQFVAVIFLPRIGPLYPWRDATRKSGPPPRYPSTLLGSRCYLLTTPLY